MNFLIVTPLWIKLSFSFHFLGTYKIDVLQGAKPVLGSPFFCQAFDPNKIKLQELGPTTVAVHDHVAFKCELLSTGIFAIGILQKYFIDKIFICFEEWKING